MPAPAPACPERPGQGLLQGRSRCRKPLSSPRSSRSPPWAARLSPSRPPPPSRQPRPSRRTPSAPPSDQLAFEAGISPKQAEDLTIGQLAWLKARRDSDDGAYFAAPAQVNPAHVHS
jgi:hypothetical protein